MLDGQVVMDGNWRLFDYDPVTGRSVWVTFDGEMTVFRTDTPVDNIIRANADERQAVGKCSKGEWNHVASIPMAILHDSGFHEAVIQDDERFIKRFLNDSDKRAWRTTEGRV